MAFRFHLLATVGCLALAGSAQAQRAIQVTPDQKRILISKDVGSQRWAITYNLDDHTATGNVFFAGGGDPQFVWCRQTGCSAHDCERLDPRQYRAGSR
jgi:hypothetical protein